MVAAVRISRGHVFHISVATVYYLCAFMMLLDVVTTAIGLKMGGYESNVIAAAIIRYHGLVGFELVKIPGVAIFVAVAAVVSLNWNKTTPVGRYAFAAAACFGLMLTAAPVANNLLEILVRS